MRKRRARKPLARKLNRRRITGGGKTGSAGKSGSAGGRSNASEFGWYGNMLHDRFYSAWIQPTTTVASGTKISTLVKVRIEKDGRVSKFEIIKPSENVVVNESVAAIAKRVTEVDSPPDRPRSGRSLRRKNQFRVKYQPGNGEITGPSPGTRRRSRFWRFSRDSS